MMFEVFSRHMLVMTADVDLRVSPGEEKGGEEVSHIQQLPMPII